MKKVNKNGFTLIELLAVITIMGILMIVAIPAVTRTIENSRKDMFIDTIKQYSNAVKNMWVSDNLSCSTPDGEFISSAVPTGVYFVQVDTTSDSVPQLLESGGKSPWGNRDIKGYIFIAVWVSYSPGKDGVINGEEKCGASGTEKCVSTDDVVNRRVSYHPKLVDGIHGVQVETDLSKPQKTMYSADTLKRGDLVMSGASYSLVTDENGALRESPSVYGDIDQDGEKESITARKCVER